MPLQVRFTILIHLFAVPAVYCKTTTSNDEIIGFVENAARGFDSKGLTHSATVLEFYFCDVGRNKLHHMTPPKNFVSRKVQCSLPKKLLYRQMDCESLFRKNAPRFVLQLMFPYLPITRSRHCNLI